jgi:hypothetical protein
MVDAFGSPDALDINQEIEFERNAKRYRFFRWARMHLTTSGRPLSGIWYDQTNNHYAFFITYSQNPYFVHMCQNRLNPLFDVTQYCPVTQSLSPFLTSCHSELGRYREILRYYFFQGANFVSF